MKKTPLLNTKLVQHMDVPMIPNVLMLDAGENLDDKLFVRGDLLDALSVDIYFKDVKSKLLNVFDVVTTKLRNHISDTYCHTNPTEKRYWNNKLDKAEWDVAMATIQQRITELENISGSTGEPVDLSGFITREQLSTALANIDWTQVNPNLSGYVKNGSLLGTINGVAFNQGGSITISGTGSGSTSYKVTGLSYNNGLLTLTQDNNSSISVNIPTGSTVDLSNYVTKSGLKTINGNSLIGSGNIQIGEGGSSFTLEPATATTLGGIKIGYAQSGRNYPVQLDANNKAYVNVPWVQGAGGTSDDPDDPNEKKDKIITLTESEFNQLDAAGQLEPDTTYIVLDDETGIVKFICYVDENGQKHITYMPQSNADELKTEVITIDQWNSMSDSEKDMNTIYIVYSGTGSNQALVGLGISKVLTRVPVPANGTVVRLSQSEYDNLGSNLDEGALYLIVANGVVTKMYLGSIEIPVGSESNEAVVKSLLTEMFSEKITWDEDKVESLNWSIINVDNPGEFYATTGLKKLVENTISEAGFLSKTDYNNTFAEMFATRLADDGTVVKKASILTSINESGESDVKIDAEKIDVTGIFDQYALSNDKKSATQILSDGAAIALRAGIVDNGVLRSTEVEAEPGTFLISAVSVDLNENVTSNALFKISTQATESGIYLKADKIYLDGNTTIDLAYVKYAEVGDLVAQYVSVTNSLSVGTEGSAQIFIDAKEDVERPRIAIYDINGDESTVIGGEESARDLGVLKNWINLNGSGYFAGGNFSWDTSGNVTVKGTVHANAMYTTPKIIDGSSYTIDMKTDPHCLYILLGAEGKANYITLPHPGDYKGLELQFFLPVFTRGTVDGFLLSTAETNGYFTPLYGLEGIYYKQYTTPTQSSWSIPMNKFVTVKSLPIGHNAGESDEWLWVVISGYDEQS